MGVFKTENEYMKRISPKMYEDTPKAVLAALLVSYLDRCGEGENVDEAIRKEWEILNLNEIVTQKAPKG
jgi:hypothetical protein